jgi:hypothetical protein
MTPQSVKTIPAMKDKERKNPFLSMKTGNAM